MGPTLRQIRHQPPIHIVHRAKSPRPKSQPKRGQDFGGLSPIPKPPRVEIKIARRNTLGPNAKALHRQPLPVELWTGINLARHSTVGMTKHALRCDTPSRNNATQKMFQRRHLRLWKRMRRGIGQLNADAVRVQIFACAPGSAPGVPRPICLAHHLPNPSILRDQVVRGHLVIRIAQPRQSGRRTLHRRVVQQNAIRRGTPAPVAEIQGRMPDGLSHLGNQPLAARNGAGFQPQA